MDLWLSIRIIARVVNPVPSTFYPYVLHIVFYILLASGPARLETVCHALSLSETLKTVHHAYFLYFSLHGHSFLSKSTLFFAIMFKKVSGRAILFIFHIQFSFRYLPVKELTRAVLVFHSLPDADL